MIDASRPTPPHASSQVTGSRAIRFVALVAVAAGVGMAASVGVALLGHQLLVLTVGPEGIPAIDDTPLMLVLVGVAYLAGAISGLAVLAFGWARFIRRKT